MFEKVPEGVCPRKNRKNREKVPEGVCPREKSSRRVGRCVSP